MDFRKYKNTYKDTKNKEEENKNNTGDNTQSNDNENMEKMYNKYKNKSQNDLMSELEKRVTFLKNSGQFSSEQLYQVYEQASPMLNSEQKKRMESLINKLTK